MATPQNNCKNTTKKTWDGSQGWVSGDLEPTIMIGLLGKGVLVLGDRASPGEVTPLPPSKTIVASRMFQPQPKAGVATHRDAFETA